MWANYTRWGGFENVLGSTSGAVLQAYKSVLEGVWAVWSRLGSSRGHVGARLIEFTGLFMFSLFLMFCFDFPRPGGGLEGILELLEAT